MCFCAAGGMRSSGQQTNCEKNRTKDRRLNFELGLRSVLDLEVVIFVAELTFTQLGVSHRMTGDFFWSSILRLSNLAVMRIPLDAFGGDDAELLKNFCISTLRYRISACDMYFYSLLLLFAELMATVGGAGTNFKVGGGTSPAQSAGKKIFLVVPSNFLVLKAQLVVLVSAFVMVSTVWSVSRLLFFYSRCPPCSAICKSGGGVPPMPYGVGATGHIVGKCRKFELDTWSCALAFFLCRCVARSDA